MDIPIANKIDTKLYVHNAKLQEIIYYDPETNTHSNIEIIKNNNYYYISLIIITSLFFYLYVILSEINNKVILDKIYNSTLVEYISDDRLFSVNYA